MAEEKTEQPKETPTEEQPKEPEKPEFQKKLEEMKAENERMEKNIAELKELKAYEALGGQSSGVGEAAKPKEQTPAEYAQEVQEGLKTGKFK